MFKFKFKFESDVGVLIGDRSLTAEEAVRCFKDTSSSCCRCRAP